MSTSDPAATRLGRRLSLTQDIYDRIVLAVRGGAYLDDAAAYAGIAERTLYLWLARGRDAEARADTGESLSADDRLLLGFQRDVARARADATIRNVTLVQQAAQTTWQAAAWWLERTNPRKWGRHETVEITGDSADETDDYERVLRERIERLRERALPIVDVPSVEVLDDPEDGRPGLAVAR